MKTLITIVAILFLSACGSNGGGDTAGDPRGFVPGGSSGSTPGTPTPPAPSTVTTLSFNFNNNVGICAAVDAFDPLTQIIIFPSNSGGTFVYTFEAAGVFIGPPGGPYSGPVGFGGNTVNIVKGTTCTIEIFNGALIDVH